MATATKKKTVLTSLRGYFLDSWQELKKVSWPTKNTAIRLTFLVLGFCLVTALILGVLDFGFGLGHKALLNLAPAKEFVPPPVQVGEEQPFESMPITVTDSEGNVIDVSGEGSPITITPGDETGDAGVEVEGVVDAEVAGDAEVTAGGEETVVETAPDTTPEA